MEACHARADDCRSRWCRGTLLLQRGGELMTTWRANCVTMRTPMLVTGLAIAALALQGSIYPKRTQEPVVAFVDVNVVPMNRDGILEHQTVIVRGTRIAEMGPAARVRAPAGATTVTGSGKYLMPGFAEMHGHFPNPNAGADLIENVLYLYVANGVTTVRGMQGQLPHLELKARVAR